MFRNESVYCSRLHATANQPRKCFTHKSVMVGSATVDVIWNSGRKTEEIREGREQKSRNQPFHVTITDSHLRVDTRKFMRSLFCLSSFPVDLSIFAGFIRSLLYLPICFYRSLSPPTVVPQTPHEGPAKGGKPLPGSSAATVCFVPSSSGQQIRSACLGAPTGVLAHLLYRSLPRIDHRPQRGQGPVVFRVESRLPFEVVRFKRRIRANSLHQNGHGVRGGRSSRAVRLR